MWGDKQRCINNKINKESSQIHTPFVRIQSTNQQNLFTVTEANILPLIIILSFNDKNSYETCSTNRFQAFETCSTKSWQSLNIIAFSTQYEHLNNL